MADQPVTLEFLARQQARLLEEMASFRGVAATLIAAFSRIEHDLDALRCILGTPAWIIASGHWNRKRICNQR